MVLFRHDFEIETQPFEHRLDDDAAGSMQRGVDNLQRFRPVNDPWIQNERFQSMHVCIVDVLANESYLALSIFCYWLVRFGDDRVHFCNNPNWFSHGN